MSEQTKLNDIANQETGVNFRSPSVLTRAEQLPSGWDVADANSITKIKTGHTPSTDTDEYWNGNIPWIAIHDLSGLDTVEIDETEDNITEEGLANSGAKLIPEGALALCRTGSIGESAILNREMATDQSTVTFECYPDLSNPYFLMYIFQWCQPELERLGIGSTHPSIQLDFFPDLQFLTPPIEEQRKIATVLHTVDQAIQKTEEMVEQVERIEQGLLQNLFSGEHLDCKYQTESTLGRIPEHWDIFPMSEVCNITMGSSPKSEYYNESGDGLPFFQANNEFGLRNPTNDRWCSNPVKTAKKGDSLMTIRGTYVGQMNIADKECCIGRGLAGISAGEKLHSEYLYHHLRRRERYVKSIAIGSTFDSVSSGDLENLLIAVPPKNEQKQIAGILQRVQQKIIFSKGYVNKIGSIKQGLMQDLLSGKVRTTDVDIDIPEEVAKYG